MKLCKNDPKKSYKENEPSLKGLSYKFNNLKEIINKIKLYINKYYPIKINYSSNIPFKLSHFYLIFFNKDYYIINLINLDGNIVNEKSKIKYVLTNSKKILWNNYIKYISKLINNLCNQDLLYYISRFNYINELHIKSFKLFDNKIIQAKYLKEQKSLNMNMNMKKKYPLNHFIFENFLISENKKNIKKELDRLILNRDKYKEIHFHIENNSGGDLIPVHLILRTLTGKKEKWMKNIIKVNKNKKIEEWDCWNEENEYHVESVKNLELIKLPDFKDKYNGKIHLHINESNGSSSWFLITYLIYSFGGKINRFTKKCENRIYKYGTINNNLSKLKLYGTSNTTSGDGNSIKKNINNINIYIPTEQFIKSSVKKKDYNRYWTDGL